MSYQLKSNLASSYTWEGFHAHWLGLVNLLIPFFSGLEIFIWRKGETKP